MPSAAENDGLQRYARQVLLPGVGEEGQRQLLGSRALVVGCGALGCCSADLLVRAGVGRVTVVDRDIVEASNLQRQVLFDQRDAVEGLPKAVAAERRLRAINPEIGVVGVVVDLTHRNAERLIDEHRPDVIVDGTDNFSTRYLINDAAFKHALPWCYGGVVGTAGVQATFVPGRTACLRCVLRDPPTPGSTPTCDTAGVLGPVVSIVAGAQAADAIKLLLGRGELLSGTMLSFDAWGNARRRIALGAGQADCPCCAQGRYEFLAGRGASDAAVLCGQDAVQITPGGAAMRLDMCELARRLARAGQCRERAHVVSATIDARPGERAVELTVFEDGRALIRGVRTVEQGRAIYDRYVGA